MNDPTKMIRPRRKITGISAILLPFSDDSSVDWDDFRAHVQRTSEAGLTPAVNMDTGYVNLLDPATRQSVLEQTRDVLGSRPFVAGAFVSDQPGAKWDADAYLRQIEQIQSCGGIPVIFQSYGLTSQPNDKIIAAYETLARSCEQLIAFELGTMFAPFGKIYDLETYGGLLGVKPCIGAKHSSLDRVQEWDRIELRDRVRPDFKVYTGNDLAIDMIMYGSDYLLGLSTFAPDLFAKRDALWENGDPAFYGLNDLLQYLGFFAFRAPVPAYKHSAAQFLKLRGWIDSDKTHRKSASRPATDIEVLRELGQRLGVVED
jgi:dihydrodipicolinate synthase/N-acetylneuraminate lyase